MKVLDLITAYVPSDDNVEQEVKMAEMKRKLSILLGKLTAREERIIRYRYMLDKTQREVAAEFGLTAQRIAQLERDALEKLRRANDKRKMQLIDYL